ncbi:MAG: Na+ dependent nucleoside transporter domain protein [Gemmataceae bacterium]|nr:Na+ dependent nucleoside transporter domain protein [Gemmataceae bacterium]
MNSQALTLPRRGWKVPIRGVLLAVIGLCVATAWALPESPQWRSLLGVIAFISIAVLCSTRLEAIQWRPIVGGMILQLTLAVLILRVPTVYDFFVATSDVIRKFIEFSDAGASFVFGPLVQAEQLEKGLGLSQGGGFIFVVKALPAVIFVSSFFTVLYHLGILQRVVRLFAWIMVRIMGTSGAESLSATANVFMGQTEAPLIVRPYIPAMTRSELLALMIGGMATIAGGVMVAYIAMLDKIGMGQQAYALLATSVMAAPCGLYLAKILLPETEEPLTRGHVQASVERSHANVIDAAAEGASQGMKLVLNITAMLIAFIAFVALINHILARIDGWLGLQAATGWSGPLSLERLLSWLFYPVALLMGVPAGDAAAAGELLGVKLALNEFVAYVLLAEKYGDQLQPRTVALLAYALTGFANFASIGIQLGGIGSMAPQRRGELAQLGLLALLGGFLATLINAAWAGLLLP